MKLLSVYYFCFLPFYCHSFIIKSRGAIYLKEDKTSIQIEAQTHCTFEKQLKCIGPFGQYLNHLFETESFGCGVKCTCLL